MASELVVFDFDWSFVDQDTDRYIFEVLKPEYRSAIKAQKEKVQWTDLCAQYLVKLHQDGFTKQQMLDAVSGVPLHPAVARGTTNYKKSQGATFLCLSNANSIYIDAILAKHNLTALFDEIITNPAHFEDSGKLVLRRRIDPDGQQHSCSVGCSPNMCKGEELAAFIQKHGGFDKFSRITYVGDGSNDFCPILRLRKQDVVFVRRFRGLERRVEKEGATNNLVCDVQKWTGAWELEQLFVKQAKL